MTWTWPEQPAPAPMPMVGMRSRSVIAARELRGHELQDDREGARLLDGERVGEQRARLLAVLALDPEPCRPDADWPGASGRCGP